MWAGEKMFTGIIEEVGAIQELRILPQGGIITIKAGLIVPGLKLGDSVAVNGVCLTATKIGGDYFSCDISAETLRLSSFKQSKPGSKVNLERALMVGGRLGGHFVLGHVDGIGKLISIEPVGDGFEVFFDFPGEIEKYLVYKGSITVNGISLTIAVLKQKSFAVAVIPHTFESTNLKHLSIGDPVNLETDILGKYFERFFQLGQRKDEKSGTKVTAEYLRNQGF
jgi:riboflavin synthase